jgi:hypothetical protein
LNSQRLSILHKSCASYANTDQQLYLANDESDNFAREGGETDCCKSAINNNRAKFKYSGAAANKEK